MTGLEPDTPAAVDFLKRLTPNDRWDLAALPPDGGKPQFRTFYPDQYDRAFDHIATQPE